MSENEKIPTVEASDKLAQQIIDKKKLELHKI